MPRADGSARLVGHEVRRVHEAIAQRQVRGAHVVAVRRDGVDVATIDEFFEPVPIRPVRLGKVDLVSSTGLATRPRGARIEPAVADGLTLDRRLRDVRNGICGAWSCDAGAQPSAPVPAAQSVKPSMTRRAQSRSECKMLGRPESTRHQRCTLKHAQRAGCGPEVLHVHGRGAIHTPHILDAIQRSEIDSPENARSTNWSESGTASPLVQCRASFQLRR